MPKAAPEDHRPARAVLHAPYPLPFIVTREPLAPSAHRSPYPPAPASVPPPLSNQMPKPTPQIPASVADFPTFKNDWRAISPAIPAVPYPSAIKEEREEKRKRVKRLRLLKLRKGKPEESSEYEMMSLLGMENEGSSLGTNFLGLTSQVGKISSGEGGENEEDSNMDENNLLIYAFVSSFERGSFDSPPSDPSLKTPTGPIPTYPAPSIHKAQDYDDNAECRSDTPIPGAEPIDDDDHSDSISIQDSENERAREDTPRAIYRSGLKNFQPLKPKTPAWDIVSDAMSSFWSDGTDADQADEEGHMRESPASQSLITPSASASRQAKRVKKASHSPDKSSPRPQPSPNSKPLFLGQTNQAPFTYIPRPRAPPSQSSIGDGDGRVGELGGLGGYMSEAGSVRTVRQIVRSRVNRMKVKRERERAKECQHHRDRSITPMQRDYLAPPASTSLPQQSIGPAQPQRQATVQGFALTQTSNAAMMGSGAAGPSIPQQSMFGLDAFAFAPFAPLLRPSEVFSSPTTSGFASQPGANQQMQQNVAPARESSFSPQPMSIDPRTTETQLWGNISWPHPLPAREQVMPSNATNLLRRFDEGVDVPMPTAESRLSQPRIHRPDIGRSVTRGPLYTRGKAKGVVRRGDEGDEDVVPLGKACHNAFLLRHRAGARKRQDTLKGVGLNSRLGGGGRGKHPRVKALAGGDLLDQHQHQGGSGSPPTGQNGPSFPTTNFQSQPQTGNLAQTQATWLAQLQSVVQQIQPQQSTIPMGPPTNWFPHTQTQAQSQSSALGQMQNWAQAIPILQALGIAFPGMYPQAQQQLQQPTQQQRSFVQVPTQPSVNQNMWFPPTPAPAQGPSHESPCQAHTPAQRQASLPPWSTQPFPFPTPGPTPHIPGPAYEAQEGHGEMKPPRKRRRSISPTSVHDLLQRTRSPSPFTRPTAATEGLLFPLAFPKLGETHLQPADHTLHPHRISGESSILGSPAQIVNKRSPTYRAPNPDLASAAKHPVMKTRHGLRDQHWVDDAMESEDGSMYDQAKLDIGIGSENHGHGFEAQRHTQPLQQQRIGQRHVDRHKVHNGKRNGGREEDGNGDGEGRCDDDVEGGETEVERVGRRDKWVHAQRRINAKGKGRAVWND
ncbi:hypothetical protein IAT40_002213 [Kwoniella sp. CBS 6097]